MKTAYDQGWRNDFCPAQNLRAGDLVVVMAWRDNGTLLPTGILVRALAHEFDRILGAPIRDVYANEMLRADEIVVQAVLVTA